MRLIDADKLPKYTGYALSADEVAMAVENAPTVDIDAITESHEKIGYDKGFRDGYAQATVDAEPVVRCKDCEYWVETDVPIFHLCARGMTITTLNADDYFHGERRKKMPRLIDEDEAYKVLTDYYHQRTEIQHKALTEALSRVPTVDAEPVRHGHWINHYDDLFPEDSTIECSLCHEHYYELVTYENYCPNCGAKMQGDEDAKTNTVINTGDAMSTRTNQRGMNYYPNCGVKMDETKEQSKGETKERREDADN